jgi:methionyl-tRNA synthetase
MDKFYITTPIYYVNDAPHAGSAYTTIAADVLARWNRMRGREVFFLTGTDEHGAKIEAKAREAGIEPQEFVNEVAAKFEFAWDELNISYNRFIRTTEEAHIKAVQNALDYMYQKGDIYKGKYKGLYCRGCEQFKSERDLVDGKCPDHGVAPEKMSEEAYLFRLSKYQDKLYEKIKNDEFKILPPERKNEVISFYEKEGLRDIAFSRAKVKWGISLPWDETHTAYVWADAFLNYLTGLGWNGNPEEIPKMWPPEVQLMSKDIMRVHTTIWPAMLLSLGLPLPKQIFVHGFFLVDRQKMSKSLGNVIRPEEMVRRFGVEATRYLLLSAATFGRDGDISWDKFTEKYNADLANGIGNLVARSIALAEKMRQQNLALIKTDDRIEERNSHQFKFNLENDWQAYEKIMDEISIDQALSLAAGKVKLFDNYITVTKPWELIKNKDERISTVMYNLLEGLRHLAWKLWPFMPDTAEKIWQSLGIDASEEMRKDFQEARAWGGLPLEIKVKKVKPLFPRINNYM